MKDLSVYKATFFETMKMLRFNYLILILLMFIAFSCKKETNDNEPNNYLIAPKEGEAILVGSDYTIKWYDENSEFVRIKLYQDNQKVFDIVNNTNNSGSLAWHIPDTLPYNNNYYIEIFSNTNDFEYFKNLEPFTIIEIPDTSEFVDTRDNQTYKIVKIGDQWWFAENFNYSQEGTSDCYTDCDYYGRLYSISDAINLSPEGWHLPSDEEWMKLEFYLGVSAEELGHSDMRGASAGKLLKEGGGLNFNARFGGYKYERFWEYYNYIGLEGRYWTSSPNIDQKGNYWYRAFNEGDGVIRKSTYSNYYKYSIRYVKDEY